MWYNKDRNPIFNHYQAQFIFKPTNTKIDAFFTSDVLGIDPKQCHYYWEIEKKYTKTVPILVESLKDFYKKNKKQEIKILDYNKEFKLFAISISRHSYLKQEWSLSFTQINDSKLGITVNFRSWEIVDVQG